MLLERTITFEESKGKADLKTLFDSGATYSCLHPDVAAGLEILLSLPRPIDVETASEGSFIRVEQRAPLDFYVNDLRLTDEFLIVPGLSEQAMIGATTMQKWKIKLDFENDLILTDPRVTRLRLI